MRNTGLFLRLAWESLRENVKRSTAVLLAAGLKLFIKMVYGSDRWCELEGRHRWDVIASDYDEERNEFNHVEVTCLECGVCLVFLSWHLFSVWAVEEISSRD